MSDPDDHKAEVDPVSGYETTGHDWNGIKELNTPFPKFVAVILLLTFIYSVGTWILLPAWPIGRDYTRGLLGLDQNQMAAQDFREMETGRDDWMSRFNGEDFAALRADSVLMARAMPAAGRLYRDNCAACHGETGNGGPGYPVLNDANWLWGGDPAVIAETLHFGINADNDNSRYAQMPAFDWLEVSEQKALAQYVSDLPAGDADATAPAALLFADNCSSCHGDNGVGGMENGAPSLADASVIYGQDTTSILQTLRYGRQGVMPSWDHRLTTPEINMLAVYVADMHKNTAVTQ